VTARHHVVIVGGGFGGLFATKALRRAEVEITLVDRTNHHLFQPLLYQVATGILSEGSVAPPLRDVLRHQRNAEVVLGEVVDVDLDARLLAVETLCCSSRRCLHRGWRIAPRTRVESSLRTSAALVRHLAGRLERGRAWCRARQGQLRCRDDRFGGGYGGLGAYLYGGY
jgi:flavin-dependent dehydrogenase